MWDLVPWPGLELGGPLHREHEILATRPPGKSLVSIYNWLLVIHRNTVNSYVLILNSAALLINLFVLEWLRFCGFVLGVFLVDYFWVLYIQNRVVCEWTSFPSSFTARMLLISYSCFIELARTSSTALNRSGASRQFCLFQAWGDSVESLTSKIRW